MSLLYTLTEGWTTPLAFTLRYGADATPLDLTGLTVTLSLRDRFGELVDTAGDIEAAADQTTSPGVVTWTPDAADLTAAGSRYTVRFKAIDGAGFVAYFEAGEADEIHVYTP